MNKPPVYSSEFLTPHVWLDKFIAILKENWDTEEIPIADIMKKTSLKRSELPWGYACPFWYRWTKEQSYNLVWKQKKN